MVVKLTPTVQSAFCMKGFIAASLYLHSVVVIFWLKEIGEIAAHKMLVKLTPTAQSAFCMKGFIAASLYLQLVFVIFLAKRNWRKSSS